MKILIYGAGVIGSIFAARLSLSGNDVTMLARGQRLSEINDMGVIIRNPNSRREDRVRVKTIENLAPDMDFDYVLVTVQKTQVSSLLDPLSKNCSKNIVFLVNNASGYDEWVNAVGKERLMVGFPAAGGERINGIVEYFIATGLMRSFQTTTFGELDGEQTDRLITLLKLFNRAGIPSVSCSNMDAWQKTHVAMVSCISNALYGYNCDNKQLARSYSSIKEMILGIKESFAVLKKLGIKITPAKLGYFNLPTWMLASFFKLIMGTKLAETTMAKHGRVARNEMIALQKELDEMIIKSGLAVPNIERLKKNLYAE